MKVLCMVSTRPEIIKMAPVIKELQKKNVDFVFAATGQHYDFLLFDKILEDLSLPKPDYNLEIGSGSPGLHVGIGMLLIERVLSKEKPTIVLAQGDTDSVLATALASHKNGFLFGHIEAGLRSYDMTMPEESNRRLTDHISNMLFAPTDLSKRNLLKENIEEFRIFVTGNTVIDAVREHIKIAQRKSKIMDILGLAPKDYILITLHRKENTTLLRLRKFIQILSELSKSGEKMIFPMHPRTMKILKVLGLWEKINKIRNLRIVEPLGYLDFLLAFKNARILLTDSGGLQEEAMELRVPTLVLRYNTERPEALGKGCVLVGMERDLIIHFVLNPPKVKGKNPFGDGKAGKRIVKIILRNDLEKYEFRERNMLNGP